MTWGLERSLGLHKRLVRQFSFQDFYMWYNILSLISTSSPLLLQVMCSMRRGLLSDDIWSTSRDKRSKAICLRDKLQNWLNIETGSRSRQHIPRGPGVTKHWPSELRVKLSISSREFESGFIIDVDICLYVFPLTLIGRIWAQASDFFKKRREILTIYTFM